MSLNKLYYVYGLDTACFYTDEENEIEARLLRARHLKNKLKNKYPTQKEITQVHKNKTMHFLNSIIADTKKELKKILHQNINLVRTVRNEKILDKDGNPLLNKKVSIFDSSLTRYLNLKEREFNTEILIVKVYFFDVAESIVKNGFYMNGHKYTFFSASAGQIRTKKFVAIREDLLKKHWNSLTAGLTIDRINSLGGMNVNKFLAYLSLCNSATDLWGGFDIDRCIVVDDFENVIYGTVDFIDDINYNIERTTKDLEFTQTDGCGMILPDLTDRNFMVRLPWIKGLLAKFDFVKFIKDNNATGIVTDIYGDVHDIIKEGIQIIFTKSQLKMWKYFDNWNEYKENFKKYGCTAGICNKEEDFIPNSVINYQMIQTLSDLTDAEIKLLATNNVNDINNLASDMNTMLKVFGATNDNYYKNGFQKCLEIYPELLSDPYSRQTLKEIKDKKEKELWSARFDIGGKYTFVIPDLYAVCEWLFLGIKNPKGLLEADEVCCKLYSNGEELDCLRSPHLYLEHPVRINRTDIEWFDTNAIYISSHDMISRIVQCDYDGDKLLVTNNQTLISAAKRNMKDVVPLFYNMKKAEAEEISPDSLFKGLLLAYNGGNIGAPSNDITKIWNSGKINEEKMKVIKWLVAEVNYTIDYAKTLYKPVRPAEVNRLVTKYTKAKVPHFFIYAKDKKPMQVNPVSDCAINRIEGIFPKKRANYNFKQNNIGKFNYKVLMNDPDTVFVKEIADTYKKISSNLNFKHTSDEKMSNYLSVFDNAKQQLFEMPYDKTQIIDNIIIDLFANRRTSSKKAFWVLFGDDVYNNIKNNIDDNFIQCQKCKKRFYKRNHNEKYCDNCKGYQKIKFRTLICCDCGKEIKLSGKVRNKKRCDDCQTKYIRDRKTKKQREYRNKN